MARDSFNNSFQIKLILETQNRNLSHIEKKKKNSTTLKYWAVNVQRDFFCKERMIKNENPKSQTEVSEVSISQLFLKGIG